MNYTVVSGVEALRICLSRSFVSDQAYIDATRTAAAFDMAWVCDRKWSRPASLLAARLFRSGEHFYLHLDAPKRRLDLREDFLWDLICLELLRKTARFLSKPVEPFA